RRSSSRNWPERPPLSNIVTTPLRRSQGFCFNPPSRLGKPVPPPKHPTLSCRRRITVSSYNQPMTARDHVATLERELRGIFGSRLQSLVVYGEQLRSGLRHTPHDRHGHGHAPVQTMAVVETLTAEDLRACAGRVAAWHDAGLATPLVLAAHEFERSLDAFPLEFGAILADHTVVTGSNPFDGVT